MTRVLIQTVVALALVLLVVGYGYTGTLTGALHSAGRLIVDTLHGHNVKGYYWNLYPPSIWYSIRLILMSILFACLIGVGLAMARVRIHKAGKPLLETIVTLFESLPDDMYIILVVILTLFLWEHFRIELPVFPDTYNPNFWDTIIPAFALACPAAFYLQRVMYLQLRDEGQSQYVATAVSKGLSNRRTFFRHIVPNAMPNLFRHIAVAMSMIISTAIFAEYFFDYQGLLFHILVASGWSKGSGIYNPNSFYVGGMVPFYQLGTLFCIGGLLVVIWAIVNLVSILLKRTVAPSDLKISPPPNRHRYDWRWLTIGIVMLSFVIITAAFPHLLTPFSPDHVDFVPIRQGINWPITPGQFHHPFGTDDLGHDMLAQVLAGTWWTLGIAFGITFIAIGGSLCIAILTYTSNAKWLKAIVQFIGNILASVPVLFIAYLTFYPRNVSPKALMHQSSAQLWGQTAMFVLGLAILEIGRGSYAFHQAIEGWAEFEFMEGVQSLGKRRLASLFSNLRSWLFQYSFEYIFVEFARVISMMVQLAALHMFVAEIFGYVPFTLSASSGVPGAIPAFHTWSSMIGEIVNGYTFISMPWLLYPAVAYLLLTTVGANLIGRGLRGRAAKT